jgi:hypothetical protein
MKLGRFIQVTGKWVFFKLLFHLTNRLIWG